MASHFASLAPAKINLFLHIIGKAPKGFHSLDSLIAFANWGDKIDVSEQKGLRLEVTGPFAKYVDIDENNIILRAANLLSKKAKIEANASILLDKHIPVGAGLGGGSADAAAVLKLLSGLWQVKISEKEMLELCLQLGADVPVCYHSKPCFVSGVGEVIEPVEQMSNLYMVLVNPQKHLSTDAVFKELTEKEKHEHIEGNVRKLVNRHQDLSSEEKTLSFLLDRQNELEVPATRLVPEISAILSTLRQLKGCVFARMSGSGASCYGVFYSELEATTAADALHVAYPEWWVQDVVVKGC